ncbi:MAG: hypothetical protein IJ566_04365 [Cardiobacteriaceae bacterium]|nr:hypothetical protein [Cardiobacteriaceae bacterium]
MVLQLNKKMENNPENIAKNPANFSSFVITMEELLNHSDSIYELWEELEIINASFLADSTQSWEDIYQQQAKNAAENFLNQLNIFYDKTIHNIVTNQKKLYLLLDILQKDEFFLSKYQKDWQELEYLYFLFNEQKVNLEECKEKIILLLKKIIRYYPHKILSIL